VNNAVSLHQQSELRTRSAVKSEIYNSRGKALKEINVYRQTNFTCTLRSIKLHKHCFQANKENCTPRANNKNLQSRFLNSPDEEAGC
jgi:hypothetical protein